MAEERIDIEVTDKVDGNVVKKIDAIATSSEKAASYLDRLKSALAAVNSSGADKLVAAMARADSAAARLINAQVRLNTAQDQGSIAASKLATQNQKLATEAARTEAAQARAAAATSSAESAAMRLAAAQARLAGASTGATAAEERLAAAQAALNARYDMGQVSLDGYMNELRQLQATAGAAVTATDQIGNAVDRANAAGQRYQAGARQTNHVNANIIAQLQDIGVSLAGGQNPLLVMIQQGSQLDYIARTMNGGWSALLGSIVRLLAPLTALASIVGGLYLAYKSFSSELATKHKPELEAYAQTLGLTSKEMKKLSNETVGAGGKLKEFDQITITSADSWAGFKSAVSQGMAGMAKDWGPVTDYISAAWDKTMGFLYMAFLGFYASVRTLLDVIGKTLLNTFKIIYNTIRGIINGVVMFINGAINVAIDGINALGSAANSVLGALGFAEVIPQIDQVNFGIATLNQGMMELSTYDIGQNWAEYAKQGYATIEGFKKAWDDAATAAAKARLAALAAAIIQNRGAGPKAKVDHTAEKRALAIGMVNLKLDDEIDRMKLLKDERAIQARMDQVEEQLAQKKIKLNDAERASILGKIQAIEAYKYVQSESDRIHEESIGPLRTMNATVEAATALYDNGSISLEKYTEQLRLATRTYDEATDPLHSYTQAIDSALAVTGKYGVELEKANYLEQIRQDLARQGKSIYDINTGALTSEVAQLVAKNDALRQQQYLTSQLSTFIDPLQADQRLLDNKTALYAELERLRKADEISEETSQRAKYALDAKFTEMRLQGASSFFGELAGLSSSSNKTLARIGKAAAIADVTIKGYMAAQNALATVPYPFNLAAAAAIAIKTGANVAGIMSTNVGNFKDGGQFVVNGRSGVDANNINMNVSNGERVTVETAAQQRAADGSDGGQAGVVVNKQKIVNMFDYKEFVSAMDTEEGEELIMNVITRRKQDVGGIIGVPQ